MDRKEILAGFRVGPAKDRGSRPWMSLRSLQRPLKQYRWRGRCIYIPFKPESSVWCSDPLALFRPSSFGTSPSSSLTPLDTAVAMAILQIPALILSFRMKLEIPAKADKSLGDGDGPLSQYSRPIHVCFRARPSKAHNHSIVTVLTYFIFGALYPSMSGLMNKHIVKLISFCGSLGLVWCGGLFF